MAEPNQPGSGQVRRIVVRKNGPYMVYGRIPLVRKTQVSIGIWRATDWQKEDELEVEETLPALPLRPVQQ